MPAPAFAGVLAGAGSRVVSPLETQLAGQFARSTGNRVTFVVAGPSLVFSEVATGLVDFGAVDAPLSPAQAKACPSCREIPRSVTAVGIGYHVPGIGHGLNLTGRVLAGIFLGQITNWSDPAITKLNPGRKLPDLKITPVHGSAPSDETYDFTSYLSAVSSRWRSSRGTATQVSFKIGVGAAGNAAIGHEIRTVKGSIGYLTTPYLFLQPSISEARVANAAGRFEYPGTENVLDAAKPVHRVPRAGASIVNPPRARKLAYPIAAFSSALVLALPRQPALVRRWLTFCVTSGRYDGLGTGFSPLPRVAQAAAKSAIAGLGLPPAKLVSADRQRGGLGLGRQQPTPA